MQRFAAFLGRAPDSATVEDLRRFQLHLVDSDTSPVSLNAAITGLKMSFADSATDWRHRANCDPSNPHSRLASPYRIGACRGFLPRGLCDASPRSVVTSSPVGASGQASHNP